MNPNPSRYAFIDKLADDFNLPLEKIKSFQEVGLIRPVKIANNMPLFGPFSRLRIKFLLSAHSQGMSLTDTLNLIGNVPPVADEATQIAQNIEVSEKIAVQLHRQIKISTPFEKVNRSCDLILLQNYIQNAKALLAREKANVSPTMVLASPPPTTKAIGDRETAPPLRADWASNTAQDINHRRAAKFRWPRIPLALCLMALLWLPFHFNAGGLALIREKSRSWSQSFFQRLGSGPWGSSAVQAISEGAGNPTLGNTHDTEALPVEDLRKPEPLLPGLKQPSPPSAGSDETGAIDPQSKGQPPEAETPANTFLPQNTPLTVAHKSPGVPAKRTTRDAQTYLANVQRRIPVPAQKFIIQCEHDSTDIADQDRETLDVIAEFVALYPATRLIIKGYTDTQGDPGYNMTLSASRARQGKTLMISKGIDPLNIQTISMGSADPIASNQTIEGKRMNRRIEIELIPEAMQ
jgi:outer membrane protein OmpA-like peptidoglycan-associated protein